MKEKVSIDYEEEKLRALDMVLKKEHSSVQQHLSRTLDELYAKRVPEAVREFIDSKTAAKPKRPLRTPAAPAPNAGVPGKQNNDTTNHEH